MGTNNLNLFFALTVLILSGCTPGFIYTDITRPECTDMRQTKVGTKSGRSGSYRLDIPTTRMDITAEWDTKAFGDIATKANLSQFYSCDERIFSILGGLFRKEEIILYGD